MHPVDDRSIRSGACDAKEIAAFWWNGFGMIAVNRHGESDRDAPNDSSWNEPGGVRNVPGNAELFRENIGGPRRQQRHRHPASREPVDDFVDRAVTAADNDH